MNNERDCKHGQLARACEICGLEAENAALRAELAELREQKPVGFVHYVGGTIDGAVIREVRFSNEMPLYRAAGAKP